MFKKILTNEFSRGGFILTASSLFAGLLNYAFNSFAARALGPSNYGEIAALFSYLYIFCLPSAILGPLVVQKISSAGSERTAIAFRIERYFWSKIIQYKFLLALFIVASPAVFRALNLSVASALLLPALIAFSLISSFYLSVFQGWKMFFWLAGIPLISTLIKLQGAVLSFFGIGGFPIIVLFFTAGVIVSLIIAAIIFNRRRNFVKISRVVPRLTISSATLIISASVIAITLFSNLDIIFAKRFFTSTEAGLYSSWALLSRLVLFAVSPWFAVFLVFFSEKRARQTQNIALLLSLFCLSAAALFFYFIYNYFAPQIVDLFFGPKFALIIPRLPQAALFGSFLLMIGFLNNYFIAKKSFAALILPVLILPYLLLLFLIKKESGSLMWFNVYFFGFAAAVMFIALIVKMYIKTPSAISS